MIILRFLYWIIGSGLAPLSWPSRVQIALDAARGLEYIHEHTKPTYIHRDIKPANILIDKQLHAKVYIHPLCIKIKIKSVFDLPSLARLWHCDIDRIPCSCNRLTFPPLQLSCEGGRLWADETHRLSRKWTIDIFADKSGWYLGLHATWVSDSMP